MNSELWVTWLLRLNAAILLMAIPTIFLPVSTMSQVHQWLGMGQFPDQPITIYLARSCSMLYGLHGGVTMLVAVAPRRHWSLIGPLAIFHMLIGAVLLVTDMSAPMPWYWTAIEGGPVMGFGILLFVLWKRATPDVQSKEVSNAGAV